MLKWPWAKNTILSCSGVAAKYTLIDSNWQQLYWSATLRDCEWLCEGEAEKKAPRALCPFLNSVFILSVKFDYVIIAKWELELFFLFRCSFNTKHNSFFKNR